MTLIFESSTCHLPGGRRTAVVHICVVKYIKSCQLLLAYVGSVSVRFQSKERGAAKAENPVPRRSSVFLCSETTRKRLLRRLATFREMSGAVPYLPH